MASTTMAVPIVAASSSSSSSSTAAARPPKTAVLRCSMRRSCSGTARRAAVTRAAFNDPPQLPGSGGTSGSGGAGSGGSGLKLQLPQLPAWLRGQRGGDGPLGSSSASQKPAPAPPVRDELLAALADTGRGLRTATYSQRERIEAMCDELAGHSGARVTTRHDVLSATWELLWTTEKETLFILENAHRFGTEAGPVYQVIDVEGRRLQNVITFPPEGRFVVDSAIEVSHETRVDFRFVGAALVTPSRTWRLPPFGKGWFDNLYVDDKIRVARDIRGDTLICTRAGPPQKFSA